jgi:hypothetical protein
MKLLMVPVELRGSAILRITPDKRAWDNASELSRILARCRLVEANPANFLEGLLWPNSGSTKNAGKCQKAV